MIWVMKRTTIFLHKTGGKQVKLLIPGELSHKPQLKLYVAQESLL